MIFLWFIFAHWFADFVCQTHWMASNKSRSWLALSTHVVTYSAIMSGAYVMMLVAAYLTHRGPETALGALMLLYMTPIFLVVTFVTHFLTDAVTSRITSRLFAKQDWHNFFVVVGMDQMIHYFTIYATLIFLGANHCFLT